MIYLFCGDDFKNKHLRYDNFIKSVSSDIEMFFISKNNFDKTQIESFYSGSGLFFTKCIVIFTNIFEKEDILNFILEKLPLISKSSNDFIFLEGKLSKSILDTFKKVRTEINIFELSKEKKEKFNNFLLANAFGARDKLHLWIYFRQAIDKGVVMEELVGVLFWKVKDMILKKNFSKFSEKELKDFISKLSYILPKARKERLDAEAVFERFLLDIF